MVSNSDPYASVDDDDCIKVASAVGQEFMEVPKEDDGTVTVSTIQTQFPDAIGLKYQSSSGAWRVIKASENVFVPPKEGWGDAIYYISVPESAKRKSDSLHSEESAKKRVVTPNQYLQDLAVMGLPYKVTTEELKEYFEKNHGELSYCEVKYDRKLGESKGYGFIRFKKEEDAREAVAAEHHFDGRKVEVRLKQQKPFKLFVGQVPDGTTKEDLGEYFSKFGEVKDTYIPTTPFRNFAFVTLGTTEDGRACLKEDHVFKGTKLNVTERNPDRRGNTSADKQQGNSSFQGYNKQPAASTQQQQQQPAQRQSSDMDTALKGMLLQYLMKN